MSDFTADRRPSLWLHFGVAAVAICLGLFTLFCLVTPMWANNPLMVLAQFLADL